MWRCPWRQGQGTCLAHHRGAVNIRTCVQVWVWMRATRLIREDWSVQGGVKSHQKVMTLHQGGRLTRALAHLAGLGTRPHPCRCQSCLPMSRCPHSPAQGRWRPCSLPCTWRHTSWRAPAHVGQEQEPILVPAPLTAARTAGPCAGNRPPTFAEASKQVKGVFGACLQYKACHALYTARLVSNAHTHM